METVIVTGGASGIGRETCLRFAEEGFRVVVADVREGPRDPDREDGTPTHERIRQDGGEAMFVETDVREWDDVRAMVDTVLDRTGRIDVLVNNAGIARTAPIQDLSLEDWRETMRVNLDGPFHGIKAVVPHMVDRGDGAIVTVSSGAGKTGFAEFAAYSASKFGVIGLTEAVAKDLAGTGVRVNAVCPGTTRTAMTGYSGMDPERVAARIVAASQVDFTGEAVDVRPE